MPLKPAKDRAVSVLLAPVVFLTSVMLLCPADDVFGADKRAQEILDAAIAKVGGRDTIQRFHAYYVKCSLVEQQLLRSEGSFEQHCQPSEHQMLETGSTFRWSKREKSVMWLDGDKGLYDQGDVVGVYSGQTVADFFHPFKMDFLPRRLLEMRDSAQLRYVGDTAAEKGETGIEVDIKGRKQVLYFDNESRLLHRRVNAAADFEVKLSDYKEFHGVRVPGRVEYYFEKQKKRTWTVVEYKPFKTLPAGTIAFPQRKFLEACAGLTGG